MRGVFISQECQSSARKDCQKTYPLLAMDPFTPEVRAAMLAPSVNPIQRTDFVHNATPNVPISCRLYRTVPVHPGPTPAPLPPPARDRLSNARLAEENIFNEQTLAHAASLERSTAVNPGGNPAEESATAEPDMIFTHGRGSTLDNEAIVSFTEGCARTQVTLSFENTGDLNSRTAIFRALMLAFPSATSLGGRSCGARAATQGSIYSQASKLVMFTYPLVRGLNERYEELLALQPDVDVLFVLGYSDPLAMRCISRRSGSECELVLGGLG